jgi:hypothetical protein
MPLTLKPTARGILRRQVLDQLSGIGDIHLALADGQWATAQTLRRRYENCLRLLDDLGWREDDPADEFAITMDRLPLMRVLARLHEHASEEVERLTEETAEARVALWESVLTVVTCGDLLLGLVDTALESEEEAAP